MKKIKYSSTFAQLLLLFGVAFLFSCKAQKDIPASTTSMNPDRTIGSVASILEVDNMDNIYVAEETGKFQKYNKKGELQQAYYNRRYGKITSIDVSNPLNILVYHGDQGLIKRLDNTLSEIKQTDLTDGGLDLIKVVATSNDGNIWIFNPTSQKVVKINDRFETLVETNPLTDFNLHNLEILKIREAGNYLVVMTKYNGFLIFDNFGQFTKLIPAIKPYDFQFDGKGLLYRTMTNFRYQKISFPDFSFVSLPLGIKSQEVVHAKRIKDHWVMGYRDGIDVVKIGEDE